MLPYQLKPRFGDGVRPLQQMGLYLFLTENNFKFDSFSNNLKKLHMVLKGLPVGNKTRAVLSEAGPVGGRSCTRSGCG